MHYVETPASPDLARFVQCVWELQGGTDALAEPIFPDGRFEIVIHLGECPLVAQAVTPQPRVIVAGQMTRALRLQPVAWLHAVGIRFTPTGAGAWLGGPAHELTDRVQGLDDLRPHLTTQLRDAAHGGVTPADRAARIENALRGAIQPRHRPPACVDRAVRLTLMRSGRVSVDALARACEISARQLERQYLDVVGLSPKAFAGTMRFQRALRRLQRGLPPALAASASGFADQSHLAREFRRIAGVPAGQVDFAHVAFVQDGGSSPASD